uniref:BHLH domain-containing protein n=1 Tax=Globodera pallida TaxID=36090 RepID=A0A183BYE7_GLOPA
MGGKAAEMLIWRWPCSSGGGWTQRNFAGRLFVAIVASLIGVAPAANAGDVDEDSAFDTDGDDTNSLPEEVLVELPQQQRVTCVQSATSDGLTRHWNRRPATRASIRAEIAIKLGGKAAEMLMFGASLGHHAFGGLASVTPQNGVSLVRSWDAYAAEFCRPLKGSCRIDGSLALFVEMSDQDFSDDGMDEYSGVSPAPSSTTTDQISDSKRQARAQHNALERRRRDNIKDMYCSLKDEIPNFTNDRASRAQILKKAIDTIQKSQNEMCDLKEEIEKLEEMNTSIRNQISTADKCQAQKQQKKMIQQHPQN